MLVHSYTAKIFVIARDVKEKTKTNTETKTNTKTKIYTFLTCPDIRDGCKIFLFSVYLPDCLLFVHYKLGMLYSLASHGHKKCNLV